MSIGGDGLLYVNIYGSRRIKMSIGEYRLLKVNIHDYR